MQRGDVVLVTGASTGIGAATAAKLAQDGFVTFAAMRGPLDRPEAAPLRAAGCHIIELDVTSQDSCEACVQAIHKAVGRIDALVNNAGVNAELAAVEEASLNDHYKTMEANYFGAVRMARLVLPEMRARQKGAIFNVTSVAAIYWAACQGAYTASKAALEALSGTLAQEVAQFGIRVCTIRPGVIVTPILTKSGTPPPSGSPYMDHVRTLTKFFQSQATLMQSPNLVAEKIATLLIEPGAWDPAYDVGQDGSAIARAIREKGPDWLIREGGKKRTDAEMIEYFKSFGVDVSPAYRKAKM